MSPPVQVIDNKIFGNSWTQTFLIDSNNGQTHWRSEPIDYGAPRSNITLGQIYHVTRNSSPQKASLSYITQLDNQTGVRDTVVTIPMRDNYNPGAEPPAGWISPLGDSILIFVVRTLNFSGDLDERLDAYAYNITADSMEWKLWDFDIDGTSSVGPPLIDENLVYIKGKRTIYCLNAADGTTVWEHRFEDDSSGFTEDLFGSAMIKVESRLVVSPSNRNTYCFDAYSGNILWKETDSASSPQNMVHYDGIIYTASKGRGRLFAFDLDTGEHYWKEYPPNRRNDSRAGFYNDIALDPETGYIYADDRFFVMCIKPYERG
ncbi:MAG: PQQ-binding-like beta-propeller repeat protein [Bacteroidota bacterium]